MSSGSRSRTAPCRGTPLLASEDSRWITGQNIRANGGLICHIGDVLRLAEPSQLRHLCEPLLLLFTLALAEQLGVGRTWRHNVDGDVFGTEFLGEDVAELLDGTSGVDFVPHSPG
jgi:hypothetical protein